MLLHLPPELLDRIAEEFDLGDIKGTRPVCSALNAAASAKVQAVRAQLGGAPPPASAWQAFGSATRLVVDVGEQIIPGKGTNSGRSWPGGADQQHAAARHQH
jgi:hypothetical protein